MDIVRQWAMPNRWTFTIKPIKELLEQYVNDGLWVDPFAGKNSAASLTNDINPERATDHHMDALQFLKGLPSNTYDGVLYDPPYSIRQAKECYDNHGVDCLQIKPNQMNYWSECKNEISRICKNEAIVICFGWNS